MASVLGREFRLDLLELLTQHTRYELLMVLDEAIRAKVIAEMNGSLGQMRFTHALVRETLYEALPRSRRHDLHRQAGKQSKSSPPATCRPIFSNLPTTSSTHSRPSTQRSR